MLMMKAVIRRIVLNSLAFTVAPHLFKGDRLLKRRRGIETESPVVLVVGIRPIDWIPEKDDELRPRQQRGHAGRHERMI